MKLTKIEMTNWLCHHHKVLEFAPLTIVSGPNSSGKSPVADAVAFALAGELRRVSAPGERQQLLTDGAREGSVRLSSGSFVMTRDIVTGKGKNDGTPPTSPKTVREALPFVLEVDRFARATDDQRSLVLRRVMGVDLKAADLKAELVRRGHDQHRVSALDDAKSIDEWIAMAQRSATEFRGAWKACTGEAYGSVKAQTWTAPSAGPVPTAVELTRATTTVTTLDVEQGDLQRRIGEIVAAERRGTGHAQNLARLRGNAAKFDVATEALATMKREKLEADAELINAEAAVKRLSRPTGPGLQCPCCNEDLVMTDGVLAKRIGRAPSTPEEIDAAEQRHVTARRAVERAEALVAEAEMMLREADSARKALELMLPGDVPGAGQPVANKADLEAELLDVQNRLGAARDAERRAQEAIAAERRATQKTSEARNQHNAVESWTKIAAALAPDGIPGELLQKALGPFNATLRDYSASVGWKQVVIGPTMGITAAGRRYELLGESERWRVDVMIAVALAVHSDLKFLLIDRFDVLEPGARSKALGWLLGMTRAGLLDTAIVMATLKSAPSAPPGAVVHWLGEVMEQKAAA